MDKTEVLAGLWPWCLTVARGMWPRRDQQDQQDLAQEGWIAMAQEFDKFDSERSESIEMFLKMHARFRMKDIVTGRHYWMSSQPHRAEVPQYTVGLTREQAELAWSKEGYEEPGYARVEAESLRGAVLSAVSELPPRGREYVMRRFYQDASPSELEKAFGGGYRAYWLNAGRASMKIRLRKSLAEYREV